MTEPSVLKAICTSCRKEFAPYGGRTTTVPVSLTLICPWCKNSDNYDWYDDETKQKLVQKKLGLTNDNSYKELTKRVDILVQELELEKGKRELLESKMEYLENWKNEREQMFKEIESFYAEEKQFREDNK